MKEKTGLILIVLTSATLLVATANLFVGVTSPNGTPWLSKSLNDIQANVLDVHAELLGTGVRETPSKTRTFELGDVSFSYPEGRHVHGIIDSERFIPPRPFTFVVMNREPVVERFPSEGSPREITVESTEKDFDAETSFAELHPKMDELEVDGKKALRLRVASDGEFDRFPHTDYVVVPGSDADWLLAHHYDAEDSDDPAWLMLLDTFHAK